jgi:hypothetical protein
MTLVQSWIDSLTLFKPKNLQLFAMVTLKSIVEAYKLYFRYFWWVIVLMGICFINPDLSNRIFMEKTDAILSVTRITYWLFELLFLAACFSTRPSVGQKNCAYFCAQFQKIILYWLFIPIFSWSSASYYGYIFTVLFFADSVGGPKNFFLSIWNAIKMVVFNLPLVVPIGAVVYVCGWVGNQLITYMLISYDITLSLKIPLAINLIGALLLPIGVCIFANIYIKKLHDQFDLYVRQPQ